MPTTTDAQRKTSLTPLAFDPSDRAFVADPYPRYAELRESPDLHRSREGLWVLTRHADVLAALRDGRLSSHPRHVPADRELRGVGGLLTNVDIELMLIADPPDHTRLRRLANKAFTPRAVEVLRPRVVELVDQLLDRATEHAEGAEVDLMATIAEPLPVMVICELLGVPIADQAQFKPWSDAIGRIIDPGVDSSVVEQALPAVMGFVQYFGALIEERRRAPQTDLLSALIAAETEGDTLSERELFAMIILLFIAGHETTTNLIGNGTLALLRHPDRLEALRDDATLTVAATEELLRYDSPVQLTMRTASEPFVLNGIELDRGEGVVCGLAAANRDPRHVDAPDELHLDRGAPTHVAFGNGMHHCLGAPLARLEGQVFFDRLARRFPSVQLSGPVTYRDHFVLRGLSSLPVSLGRPRPVEV